MRSVKQLSKRFIQKEDLMLLLIHFGAFYLIYFAFATLMFLFEKITFDLYISLLPLGIVIVTSFFVTGYIITELLFEKFFKNIVKLSLKTRFAVAYVSALIIGLSAGLILVSGFANKINMDFVGMYFVAAVFVSIWLSWLSEEYQVKLLGIY